MKKAGIAMIAGSLLALTTAMQVQAGGEETYSATCQGCHATGAAGAPKVGDKEAWAPRIATGMDALVSSAINGKGVMPPKGGCAACTDADLSAAVEYMVSQSQ